MTISEVHKDYASEQCGHPKKKKKDDGVTPFCLAQRILGGGQEIIMQPFQGLSLPTDR